MKVLRILTLTGILALAGCTGAMTFDQHLRQLEGHPVNDADLMLGHHADGQYQDGTDTVFVWQDHKVESILGGANLQNGYQIGNTASNGNSLIWGGVVMDTCVIRATTNDGIIKRIRYEGSVNGCETIYGYHKEPLGMNGGNGHLH